MGAGKLLDKVTFCDLSSGKSMDEYIKILTDFIAKYPELFLSVEQETEYIGAERLENEYPIKSFIEAGAVTVFHTDYPVSQNVSIPNSIHTAVLCRNPGTDPSCARKANEFITRYQALEGLTKNVATLLQRI